MVRAAENSGPSGRSCPSRQAQPPRQRASQVPSIRSRRAALSILPAANHASGGSAARIRCASQSGASSTSLFTTASQPVLASWIPRLTARLKPAFVPIGMTRAPSLSAASGAPSSEPLSTIRISAIGWVCALRLAISSSTSARPFQTGTMIETPSGISLHAPSSETLLHQEEKIVKAVTPGIQLDFAQPRTVLNGNFAETDARILEGFYFDFFRKCHAVGFQPHLVENAATQHPHAGLRIAHPAQIEHRHGEGQRQVSQLVLEAHGACL